MIDYWENVREVRDISNVIEPLFETDKRYYTKEEFESEPILVIHLAKNKIYARHGYIFTNKIVFEKAFTENRTGFSELDLSELERGQQKTEYMKSCLALKEEGIWNNEKIMLLFK